MRIVVRKIRPDTIFQEELEAINKKVNEGLRELRDAGINGYVSRDIRCKKDPILYNQAVCGEEDNHFTIDKRIISSTGPTPYEIVGRVFESPVMFDISKSVSWEYYPDPNIIKPFDELVQLLPKYGILLRAWDRITSPEAYRRYSREKEARMRRLLQDYRKVSQVLSSLREEYYKLDSEVNTPDFEVKKIKETFKELNLL